MSSNIQAAVTDASGVTVNYLFPDQPTAEAWVAVKAAQGMFGQNAVAAVPSAVLVPAQDAVPAVLDASGNVITPAVPAVPAVMSPAIPAIPQAWSVVYTDISAQAAHAAAVEKGLSQQADGAKIIAAIFALNESKIAAGTLNVSQLQTMMQDPTLALIRELLWAGSIATAKALISASSSPYFSSSDVSNILAFMASMGY